MRLISELKEILYKKGKTMTWLAEQLSIKLEKKYSLANLSNKIRRESISYKDLKLIAKIVDYKLELNQK